MKQKHNVGCTTSFLLVTGLIALFFSIGFGIWSWDWMFITKIELHIVICGLIFSALCFGVGILSWKIDKKNAKKNEEIEEQKQRQIVLQRKKYEKALSELSDKFGTCTINEKLSGGRYCHYSISTRFLVYEQSSVIVIKSKEYKFSDILGYSLVDDATSETIMTSAGTVKTSTGSMLGRAVVGGVLIGGLGAVTGAVTAKNNISNNATSQTATTHNYTLYINVNSLQEPTISLKIGDDTLKAQKIAGVLNIIVERNKQAEK